MRTIDDIEIEIIDHYQNPYGEIYFNNFNGNSSEEINLDNEFKLSHVSIQDINTSNESVIINYKNRESINLDFEYDESLILGDSSNNYFSSELILPLNNFYYASTGDDIYVGSKNKLDVLNYDNNNFDLISGLQVVNSVEEVFIREDKNLLKEFINSNDDNLIIFKENKNENLYDFDQLADIDIIRLTDNDDEAILRGKNDDLIIDFNKGDDTAIVHSYSSELTAENYINLEKLVWHPINSSDNPEKSSFEFDVFEVYEGVEKIIPIGEYKTNEKVNKKNDWHINYFKYGDLNEKNIPNWLTLDSVEPNLSLVGEGNIVISYDLEKDQENESLTWIKLYANDLRDNASGLLGLELDLNWDNSNFSIDEDLYNLKNVFNSNKLPLFRNKGLIKKNSIKKNRTYLSGLGAASLPKANQGEILGLKDNFNDNTLFAKIPLKNFDDQIHSKKDLDLNIEIKLMPQVGGEIYDLDNVLILDNNAPLVNILRANPDDKDIRSYAFSLEDQNDAADLQNIILTLREINDVPKAIDELSDINLEATQDSPFFYSLSDQFYDEDDINLEYTIVNNPNWIVFDNESKSIIGTPKNNNVGNNNLIVKVSDGRGGEIEKEIKILVKNVNDDPFLNNEIQLPEIFQDQKIDFLVPQNSFGDPDLLVSNNEKLNYSIFDKDGSILESDFINFDKESNKLKFNPKQVDVGSHEFKVRATDSHGKYAEQIVTLKVKNKNDAPIFTEKFDIFKNLQSSSLDLNLVSEEEIKNLIFIDTKTTIDISQWVKDIDMAVDINEALNFTLDIIDNDGQIYQLNDNNHEKFNWISFANNKLEINATEDNIGSHFIRFVAFDAYNENISSLFEINVRHKNRAPVINENFLNKDIFNIKGEGILNSSVVENSKFDNSSFSKVLLISLEEESTINFDLPSALFTDPDLLLDINEKLSIKMIGADELFNSNSNGSNIFEFDENNLNISGSTRKLGVDKPNGSAIWKNKLIAKDNYGESIDIDLIFSLQRTALKPSISISNIITDFEEGESKSLSQFFKIDNVPRDGDRLFLEISQIDNNPYRLDLFSDNNLIEEILINNKPTWKINGNWNNVDNLLENIKLKTSNKFGFGDFKIEVKAYSELGLTSLISENSSRVFDFQINPKVDTPNWIDDSSEDFILDDFDFSSIGNFYKAELPDKNEKLSYKITFNDELDIDFTNLAGEKLGLQIENSMIFNNDEWQQLIIRNKSKNANLLDLKIEALSYSNVLKQYKESEHRLIKWKAIPLIEKDPNINIFSEISSAKSGELVDIEIDLDLPSIANSSLMVLKLKEGSELFFNGKVISFEKKVNKNEFYYVNLNNNNNILRFQVRNPDIFNGLYQGEVSIYTSVKENLNKEYLENSLISDTKNKLITKNENNLFSWEVSQIAFNPEINSTNLNQFGFDPNTGRLNLEIRRGSSRSGKRNPREALILGIQNIPNGYQLVNRVDGKYSVYGATDEFGTFTIVNIPSLPSDTSQIELESFNKLNQGNLYLIPNNKKVSPLKDHKLKFLLSSRIIDNSIGDTSSDVVSEELYLNTSNNLPVLDNDRFIDPLVIDLNNDGIQFLAIDDPANKVRFNMIPTKGKYKTSWITNKEDTPFDNAFLALNDVGNDNGDIQILSINELFSEYFKSDNIHRKFLSGTEALLSLDDNKDKIINNLDAAWKEILLWFDDGDGISQKEEIFTLDSFVSKIDLNTKESLYEQPSWSSSNILLSQSDAFSNSINQNTYKIYDVGLENFLGDDLSEKIEIDLLSKNKLQNNFSKNNNLITDENDNQAFLKIVSPSSSTWIEEGIDSLTLIRLSGLPNEITLPLGLKDSIGDWVFTWEDFKNNNNEINLIANDFWSGNFSLKALVSQIQTDGSIKSSILKSINVEVIPVANKPYLNLKNITAQEDEIISFKDLISSYGLRDKDGSERLAFRILELPDNSKLIDLETLEEFNPNEKNFYEFESGLINNIGIKSPSNFSGKFEFKVKLIAIENSNLSEAELIKNVQISFEGVPDKPKKINYVDQTNKNGLIQDQVIKLNEIIDLTSSSNFEDNDGSEEKLVEIFVDQNLALENNIDSSWNPIFNSISEGISKYLFRFNDLENLVLRDNGISAIDKFELEARLISKEISNGKSNKGDVSKILLDFQRNAGDPVFKNIAQISLNEDFDFYSLDNFIEIDPYLDDSLIYIIDNLSSSLNIFDLEKNQINKNESNEIVLNKSLNNYFIKSIPNISGDFTFNIRTISSPPGLGLSKESIRKKLDLSINSIADIPIIDFDNKDKYHKIESNGWFDLGKLNLQINSSDTDKSENYLLKIGLIDQKGEVSNLPLDFRLNIDLNRNSEGFYEIAQENFGNLYLYMGIIPKNLELALIPISLDGISKQVGEKIILKIASNEVLKIPLIDVAFNPNYDEDQRVPLLKENGGPLEANLISSAGSQKLELEFSNIPDKAKLQKRIFEGNLIKWITLSNQSSSITIPYDEAKELFFKPPEDHTGNIELTVRALSFDSNRNSKASVSRQIKFNFNPINDAPFVIDSSDLAKVDENFYKEWNLLERFDDIDNLQTDIEIKSINLLVDDKYVELPNWLNINSEGILFGTPSNEDVGFYDIYTTANDPSGLEVSINFNLEVGNTNSSPFLTNYIPKSWLLRTDNKGDFIFKTLDLRDNINLVPSLFFDDNDLIHNEEKHIYSLSQNLVDWGNAISNLAELKDGILDIEPISKSRVGNQIFYLKATDLNGASVVQKISLYVNDINEPPIVLKEGAKLISQNRWQEEIFIEEDKEFIFDLNNLFVDNDDNDILGIINPSNLPLWLKFDVTKNNYGGILHGTPQNNNVGAYKLIWQAVDLRGQKAIYELIINVINTNDVPTININPDYSNFGKIINGISTTIQEEYTSLDLSKLFTDDDLIHGDNLKYEILEISKDNNIIENQQEWIDIIYRSTSASSNQDKLYLEPVFYKYDDSLNLVRLENDDLESLQKGTELVVSIQLIDNRKINNNGILGIDLDIILGDSFELVQDSALLTNKLPLFNNILASNNSIRVEAGSLPEIGQGEYIGIDNFDEVISFKTILNNPQENIFLGISQGKGINRDGLTGRNQEIFNEENSLFYSYSSRDGADLHIMYPKNNDVGKYNLKIKAIDSYKANAITNIPFEILNKNDKPYVNRKTEILLEDLLDKEYLEQLSFNSGPLNLFWDDDLIHNSAELNFEIIQGDINRNINTNLYAENILNIETIDNSINLSFEVPLGLTYDISQDFKLKATDLEGEEVETDWFNLYFKPKADLTNITKGNNKEVLDILSLGNLIGKNVGIKLGEAIEINSIEPNDILGDKVFLNIEIGDEDSYIKYNIGDNPIIDNGKINEIGEKEFKIDLENLAEISGNSFGDIQDIELIVSPNKFEFKPSKLDEVYANGDLINAGISIDLWTETRVNSNEDKYPIVESDKSTIWIPIDNYKADFITSRPLNIDETFFEVENNFILDMNDYFDDKDPNENITWEINLPRKIKNLIKIDNETGRVKFTKNVNTFDDLPLGIHKIICQRKDSSYSFGQESGISRGVVRVAFRSNKTDQFLKGIDLLRQADSNLITEILDKEIEDLNEAESNLLDILEKLNKNDRSEKIKFIEKINLGNMAILETSSDEKIITLDSANSQGALFLESSSKDTTDEMDLKISNIYNTNKFKSPAGEIDFSLDTDSSGSSIVFIDVLDLKTDIDSVIKTNIFDQPSLFDSEKLIFDESGNQKLQDWLDSLEFNLNYYALPNSGINSELESLKINMNDNLTDKLSSIGFSSDHLPYIDGSSYLLDTDNDGLVDKIALLLVDQGYFDLDREIGFIRDPIIPIVFDEIELLENIDNQDLNDQTPTSRRSEVPPELNQAINSNIQNLIQNPLILEDNSLNKQNINNFEYINKTQDIDELEINNLKVSERKSNYENNSVFKKLKKINNFISDNFNLAKGFSSRLIESPLESFLLIMFSGIFSERILNQSIDTLTKDRNLKIKRRNELFQGRWLFPTRDNRFLAIDMFNSKIEILNIKNMNEFLDNYSLIPGIDKGGKSLLSEVINDVINPGIFIKEISIILRKLSSGEQIDLNWNEWINKYFLEDNNTNLRTESKVKINELKSILLQTDKINVSMSDVVMYAQFVDVARELKIDFNM